MNTPWFRHNERGIGPGRPIHRNGWILLGAYVGILIVFPVLLEAALGYPPGTTERFIFIVSVTVPFAWLAMRKTEGGWRRH